MPAPRMQGRHAVTDIWPSGRRDTLEWKWLSQAAFRVVAPESGNRGRETSDRGDEKGGKLPDQLQRVAGVADIETERRVPSLAEAVAARLGRQAVLARESKPPLVSAVSSNTAAQPLRTTRQTSLSSTVVLRAS